MIVLHIVLLVIIIILALVVVSALSCLWVIERDLRFLESHAAQNEVEHGPSVAEAEA